MVRLDRLARSIAHLLAVVEGLRAFPLTRPTDTGVGGVLVLQMLGAVAEFERSLIRERIKAACKPPRRADGWAAIRDCVRATQPFCASSQPHAGRHGLALLPDLTGDCPWCANCVRPSRGRTLPRRSTRRCRPAITASPPRTGWSARSSCSSPRRWLNQCCWAPLRTGRPRKEQTTQKRATEVVAALVAGRSTITLAQLGTELTRLGLAPVRGGNQWAPSSVKALLDRARAAGLLAPTWRQPLSASEARHPLPRVDPAAIAIGVEKFRGFGLTTPART